MKDLDISKVSTKSYNINGLDQFKFKITLIVELKTHSFLIWMLKTLIDNKINMNLILEKKFSQTSETVKELLTPTIL